MSLLFNMPSEKSVLQTNDSIILSGETLYYDFYCLLTNAYSDISKIAYVELVNSDRKAIFKHKLKLQKGRASGDFFLSTYLETGHYKLIGYTNWSLNNLKNKYAQKDIYIINPYLNADDNNLIKTFSAKSSYIKISKSDEKLNSKENIINSKISLSTNSNVYGKREKVALQIKNNEGAMNFGVYTLSVKKRDSIFVSSHSAFNLDTTSQRKNIYLPDLRGELISGKVVSLVNKNPIENIRVSFSMEGDEVFFKTAITNKTGKFYFNMQENYFDKVGYLQLDIENKDKYKIILDTVYFNDYNELEFYPLRIDENIGSWLQKRSINNQIESAYYNLKQDSLSKQQNKLPFYGQPDLTYILDEYTRFKTLKETFVEVIQQAAIRNDGEGYKFLVYENELIDTRLFSKEKPLLLFNGVHFIDEKYVVEYDVDEIESVKIVKGTFIDGLDFYNGIIDIRLKSENNFKFNYNEALKLNLKPIINTKRYFYQTQASIDKRVPDFRALLLWMPNFVVNSSQKEIEFFTSSNAGIYEVKLEGFTEQGKKISVNSIFEVK